MRTPVWLGSTRLRLERVDSTSDELWRRARRGAPHGTVLSAAEQTSGRGRQGRSWCGGRDNLLVSWLLRLDRKHDGLSALSVVQGIALASALDSLAPGRIRLKWPNDLLLDGRKVGGLLLESRPVEDRCVVSGLGLNLVTPDGGWQDLAGRAAALDEVGPRQDAVSLLETLLGPLESAIDTFLSLGPGPALSTWSRWSALDGQQIRWEDPAGTHRGLVLGLTEDGGLRVRGPEGRQRTLHAGDVHLEGSA